MFIALPVEIKNRELDSRLYIASKLLKKNIPCVIGNKSSVNGFCYSYGKPYVYLAKSASINNYDKITGSGGVYTVLDEEGGIYHKDFESTMDARNPGSVVKCVELYFAWGEVQKDYLVRYKHLDPEKVLVSGNPRFDLSKPEFRDFHKKLSSGNIDIPDNYILVSTRFKRFNHQLGDDGQTRFVNYMTPEKSSRLLKNPLYAEERTKKDRDYQADLFPYFIQLIEDLSNTFRDVKVVIRPHPAEDIDTYHRHFKSFPNVVISREGSIFQWISRARLVINHDCTTGVEAMLHGVPTISYTPLLDEDIIQWLPVMAGYKIDDGVALVDVVRKNIIERNNTRHFLEKYDTGLMKSFIANLDFDSAEMIADSLAKKVQEWTARGGNTHSIDRQKKTIPMLFSNIIMRANKRIRMFSFKSGEKKKISTLKKNKFLQLDAFEIKHKLATILPGDSILDKVSVCEVGKSAYLLSIED